MVWPSARVSVANAARVEIAENRARVLGRQVGVEHAHRRLRDAHDDEGEEADQRQRHGAHRGEPRGPEPVQEVQRPVHAARRLGCAAELRR
jgi:hypothetical protein